MTLYQDAKNCGYIRQFHQKFAVFSYFSVIFALKPQFLDEISKSCNQCVRDEIYTIHAPKNHLVQLFYQNIVANSCILQTWYFLKFTNVQYRYTAISHNSLIK